MWGALLRSPWTSLAVVPTDQGIATQPVVAALKATVETGSFRLRGVDARDADVQEGKRLASQMSSWKADGERVAVVVDALTHSLTGVHLVEHVGAVLLVVMVGGLNVDALTSTVAIVGADRIVGSVTAPSRL